MAMRRRDVRQRTPEIDPFRGERTWGIHVYLGQRLSDTQFQPAEHEFLEPMTGHEATKVFQAIRVLAINSRDWYALSMRRIEMKTLQRRLEAALDKVVELERQARRLARAGAKKAKPKRRR